MTDTKIHQLPPNLPVGPEAWLAVRKGEKKRTLNDEVESIHIRLSKDEDYTKYLYAVYDSQALEGSLSADNFMAATIIRREAQKIGNPVVASEKLATINQSLGVCLRRFSQSRKQRRNTIGGEIVEGDNGD
jgi:hypothetical protein